jgi:ribonuclease H2 subunit C
VKTNPIAIQRTGAILQKTNIILPTTNTTTSSTTDPLDDLEEQADSTPETKLLQELATFDKITVYGHEVQPDAQEDVYVKGINEWIGLAGAVSFRFPFCFIRARDKY